MIVQSPKDGREINLEIEWNGHSIDRLTLEEIQALHNRLAAMLSEFYVMPLQLRIEHYTEGRYLVYAENFVLHGIGATVEEAVEEYLIGLREYHEDLHNSGDKLAPHLRDHMLYLDRLLGWPPEHLDYDPNVNEGE